MMQHKNLTGRITRENKVKDAVEFLLAKSRDVDSLASWMARYLNIGSYAECYELILEAVGTGREK